MAGPGGNGGRDRTEGRPDGQQVTGADPDRAVRVFDALRALLSRLKAKAQADPKAKAVK